MPRCLLAALVTLVAACAGAAPASGSRTAVSDEAPRRGYASPPPAAARAPIECGDRTCGPDEVCVNQCECCGTRVPDPSEARGSLHCEPMSSECRSGATPPEQCPRRVDRPCA